MRQVRGYAAQVRMSADSEYHRGIPMRCLGNPRCSNWWIHRLNDWYGGQMNMVRAWRHSIVMQCQQQPPQLSPPAPPTTQTIRRDPRPTDLRTSPPADAVVEITIPSTPAGYSQ